MHHLPSGGRDFLSSKAWLQDAGSKNTGDNGVQPPAPPGYRNCSLATGPVISTKGFGETKPRKPPGITTGSCPSALLDKVPRFFPGASLFAIGSPQLQSQSFFVCHGSYDPSTWGGDHQPSPGPTSWVHQCQKSERMFSEGPRCWFERQVNRIFSPPTNGLELWGWRARACLLVG